MPADRLLHRRAGHSRKVCGLTDFEYRVWTQYVLSADDFGILPLSAVAVQRDNDYLEQCPPRRVMKALQTLVTVVLLRTFEHQGKAYLFQPDWQDWQKVRWPARTLNPCPPTDHVTAATAALLKVFPGGSQVPPKVNGSTSGVLTSTREAANATRLTASRVLEDQNRSATWLKDRKHGEVFDFQATLRLLTAAYPEKGRSSGYLTEVAFHGQLTRPDDLSATPAAIFEQILANLETQKAGAQWTKGFIPKLERWLREGLWTQIHEPAGEPRLPGGVKNYHAPWECPHVEPCNNRTTCGLRTEQGRPEKNHAIEATT